MSVANNHILGKIFKHPLRDAHRNLFPLLTYSLARVTSCKTAATLQGYPPPGDPTPRRAAPWRHSLLHMLFLNGCGRGASGARSTWRLGRPHWSTATSCRLYVGIARAPGTLSCRSRAHTQLQGNFNLIKKVI